MSIAYDFRPGLRSRLTLSGRAFLRKPWIFGGKDSHLALATHANILSRIQSTITYDLASARIRCSSTNYYVIPKLRYLVPSPSRLVLKMCGFAYTSASSLGHAQPTACSSHPSASPHRSNDLRWYRNLNLLSIAYGCRPRLRPRLTLSGRTFLRKPRIFGGQDSHLPCATHANILSRIQSRITYDLPSARIRCSSTNVFTFLSFGSKF